MGIDLTVDQRFYRTIHLKTNKWQTRYRQSRTILLSKRAPLTLDLIYQIIFSCYYKRQVLNLTEASKRGGKEQKNILPTIRKIQSVLASRLKGSSKLSILLLYVSHAPLKLNFNNL